MLGEDEMSAERRAQLTQIIMLLRAQLTLLLERTTFSANDSGQSFSTTKEMNQATGIRVIQAGTEVAPYIADSTDFDDDSIEFNIKLEVHNTDTERTLLIERESGVVEPKSFSGTPVSIARTFNQKTGSEHDVTSYGFDANDRKFIAIEPGQSSEIHFIHAYQFAEPGEYRGELRSIKYIHDNVSFDPDTVQFVKNNRPYTADLSQFRSIYIKDETLWLRSTFVDEEVADDKIDLVWFDERGSDVRFEYPEEFEIEEDDGVYTLSYNDVPLVEVGDKDFERDFDVVEVIEEKADMLNDLRAYAVKSRFIDGKTAGTMTRIESLSDADDFAVIIYNYADDSLNFNPYVYEKILTYTFEVK